MWVRFPPRAQSYSVVKVLCDFITDWLYDGRSMVTHGALSRLWFCNLEGDHPNDDEQKER
jgi:hypothetical protein